MSLVTNIAQALLSNVNTTQLFMNIDKRHSKNLSCNTLFFKFKHADGTIDYCIQEFDVQNGRLNSRIPSKEESLDFIDMLKLDGNKICKYTIGGSYITESFEDCDLCFCIFSKHIDSRTRSVKALYSLCSILFLKVQPTNLYIDLVCAEDKSSSELVGYGTKLINFCEELGKLFKHNKIILSSVDTALGFYLSRNFRPISGKDLYEIKKGIKINVQRSNGSFLQRDLPKTALYMNNMGMTTSYKDASRLLPKANNTSNRRRSLRNNAGRKFIGDGTIGSLSGVKINPKDKTLVMMQRNINYGVVAQGKKNKGKKPKSAKKQKSNIRRLAKKKKIIRLRKKTKKTKKT